jgi:hypothetical protein
MFHKLLDLLVPLAYKNTPISRLDCCRDDYVPVKERKLRLLESRKRQLVRDDPSTSRNVGKGDAEEMPPPPPRPAAAPAAVPQRSETSLLKATAAAKQNQPPETEKEREAKEEKALMQSFLNKQALRSAQENAIGTLYTEPMKTGWTPPSWCVCSALPCPSLFSPVFCACKLNYLPD